MAIWGTGTPRREFLYVDDMAAASVHVMNLPPEDYARHTQPMLSHVNVGCGEDVTIAEVARLVAEVVGYAAAITFDTSRPDGTPRDIPPHNPWLVTIGLFLIYTGFWGFYAACNIPMISPGSIAGQITGETWTTTNIYLTPTTLSAITMNFLMALSGGMMAGYIFSKGDAFWTYSAGLCGIIGASAGNDLYHPIQAMFIGAIVPYVAYKLHFWVERTFKIDDAVGAVAVHGYGGFMGVVIAGFVLWGAPSSPYEGYAVITPWGNFIGGCIMVLLGFVPVYILCKILNAFGLLRIPAKIELEGLDFKGRAAYDAAIAEITAAERAMLK